MSLGPQGGRSLLATMWRLAIARQQLLLVALAWCCSTPRRSRPPSARSSRPTRSRASRARSSTSRARSRTRSTAPSAATGRASAAVALYVLVRPWPLAWIRASYIRALATTGGFPRPAWPIGHPPRAARRLHRAPRSAFGIGILEKADLPEIGPPVLLAVLVFTLYADYAIVIDDIGLRQAFRSSLHVLLRRPGASLGVTAAVADALVRARAPRSGPRSTAARRRSP